MKLSNTFIALLLVTLSISCGKDDDTGSNCDTSNITYTNTVKGIFDTAGCSADGICHGPHQTNDFSLDTYNDVKDFAFLDRMVSALRWENGFSQMPKDSITGTGGVQLEACDIDKIEAWIAAGTPE